MNKNNIISAILLVIVVLVLAYFGYKYYSENLKQKTAVDNFPISKLTTVDPLNTTYTIENHTFTLINGKAEKEITQGSQEKINVYVLGTPNFGDLNNDKVNDAVVILIYTPGGSGVFYYVAVAIKDTENNTTIGSNAILLGDRIAFYNNSINLDGEITVNYADRKNNEPFTTLPSVNVSRYFLVSGNTLIENSGK
jgi:hypothetical protein